jgi:hypothetical protein
LIRDLSVVGKPRDVFGISVITECQRVNQYSTAANAGGATLDDPA